MKRMTNAIVVIEEVPTKFVKYHNINIDNLARFKKFVKGKFEKARYVNFYDKDTKQFIRREYVNN